MRRRAKIDTNQPEIVKVFRQLGCSVFPTHQVGGGFPDIVVGYKNSNYLLEIKDGSLSPSRRALTPDERAFHEGWLGQVDVVTSVDDVGRLVTRWRAYVR